MLQCIIITQVLKYCNLIESIETQEIADLSKSNTTCGLENTNYLVFAIILILAVFVMMAVEMGRRYFPSCSEVLDKFMEDDLPDLFYLEKGTPDEQRIKRTRFMELKEDVHRAFTKDKAEINLTGLSSSSSSSSLKDGISNKLRKL
jgi:hypothetical protein